MRRGLTGFVQVPLLVLATSLVVQIPLLAQRTAATGSVASGHFAGAVHSAPAPTFSGPPRNIAPSVHAPSVQAGQPRHWPGGVPTHPTGGNRDGRYRQRYPAFYAGYPWLAYGYGVPLGYGMPYADDANDSGGPSPIPQQQADEASVDYGPEPSGPQGAPGGGPSFRPPYQGPYQGPFEGPPQVAPVHPQPATVLIFNDGRPPQKVHNYALTGSTLYALDGDLRQEIPLALLNVPATVETNRAAGVDFSLPVSR